ncbi:hypothetical protein I8751_24350 [Nostocaceae cyanobacterium CENA357]|uniref:Uncharacterized protein n=1 Tax=Atlanticothrix silvestris CENA357 TaxID=1725252 RepID=A0A8J7HII3_9CYAN|nr:hypothetical protein [Atlanticothrix silvestris CENA357]
MLPAISASFDITWMVVATAFHFQTERLTIQDVLENNFSMISTVIVKRFNF